MISCSCCCFLAIITDNRRWWLSSTSSATSQSTCSTFHYSIVYDHRHLHHDHWLQFIITNSIIVSVIVIIHSIPWKTMFWLLLSSWRIVRVNGRFMYAAHLCSSWTNSVMAWSRTNDDSLVSRSKGRVESLNCKDRVAEHVKGLMGDANKPHPTHTTTLTKLIDEWVIRRRYILIFI